MSFEDKKTGKLFISDLLNNIKQSSLNKESSGWIDFSYEIYGMKENIMYYIYLPKYKWIVASVINKEEILASYNDLETKLIIAITIMLIIVILLIMLIAKYLNKRIKNLVKAAEALSENNYNFELQKEANDEIGDLEDSFNHARDKIKNLIHKQEESNTNLKVIIGDKTKELQKNIDILSKYIIYSKTDLKGIITESSDAFSKISQYSTEELIGQPHNIIRHPDMPKSVFKEMWNTIKNGKVWNGEVKNLKKDGTYYWVEADISPQYDKDGNITSYLAIRHDITAKKDFEEQHKQLIQSEKMASMGEMIGNIAHQWRQPLSVISTGASGLIIQKEYKILTDKIFNETCKMIDTNAQHLSKTIDDFTNFIKGDRKKQVFDLEHTINSFLNLVEGSIKSNNIDIILDLQNDIKVDGYENELIQCLINIYNNAKDIMLEKNVDKKLVFISASILDNQIILKIKDSGGGIPDEVLPKIFDPYFTTKHQSQGTGLGLHMTYNLIVDGMNGTIEANNVNYEYNDKNFIGAEFKISLSLT